jgi:hypothetical protein
VFDVVYILVVVTMVISSQALAAVVSASGTANIIVNIDDYYMDTSYNSNPDLFEVKKILLNIVIQWD